MASAAVSDTARSDAPAGVPDFDSDPVTHRVAAAEPIARGVRVIRDDRLESRHPVFMPRENAPDPGTTHPVIREQALQLMEIPVDLEAVAAAADAAGGLWVRWSTGEDSRCHPGWLRAWMPTDDRNAVCCLPSGWWLWTAGPPDRVPAFDDPTSNAYTAFSITLRRRPGDLPGFDNRRILHGRSGFDPATGDRWQRGCSVAREDLQSRRIRVAARQRRHRLLAAAA